MSNTTVIFLTGVTGYLGSRLLVQLSNLPVKIYCLVRPARSENGAQGRLLKILEDNNITPEEGKYIAVEGDIRKDKLGISDEKYLSLSREVEVVFHSAASVNFLSTKEALKSINVVGAINVMNFAQRCYANNQSFDKFCLVSTAYVAGKTSGVAEEIPVTKARVFNNNYEESKWLAEQRVVEEVDDLPYVVIRPSIIIGSAIDGRAESQNVIYGPFRIMIQYDNKKPQWLPGYKSTRLDFVPVDYVAECCRHIIFEKDPKPIYHLTSGPDNQAGMNNMFKSVSDVFSVTVKLYPYWLFDMFIKPFLKLRKNKDDLKFLRIADAYGNYMKYKTQFDDRNTAELRYKNGIVRPSWNDVFTKSIRYAKDTNFARDV